MQWYAYAHAFKLLWHGRLMGPVYALLQTATAELEDKLAAQLEMIANGNADLDAFWGARTAAEAVSAAPLSHVLHVPAHTTFSCSLFTPRL